MVMRDAAARFEGVETFPECTRKYFDFFFQGNAMPNGKRAEYTGYFPTKALFAALESNDPSYTELDCANRGLDDDMMYQVVSAMKGNTSVTSLKLANNLSHWNEQGDRFGLALAPILATSKTITHVDLHKNNLHEKSISALAEALKHNKSIISLNLEDCYARKSAKDLGDALKENNTLTWLNVNVNQIADEEAKHLLECLKMNKSIKHFSAYNNRAVSKDLRRELRGFSK